MFQVQLYTHMSWLQQNVTTGTCLTSACLNVYRLTGKHVQTFGRLADQRWVCVDGCPSNVTVSDFGDVYFTDVRSRFTSSKYIVTLQLTRLSERLYVSWKQYLPIVKIKCKVMRFIE